MWGRREESDIEETTQNALPSRFIQSKNKTQNPFKTCT